ncbi:MAG: hypothetical protein KC457_18810 [Myxococcales bacterium]|nr:hypothetical protein [Myxococcales bacterium]
MSGSDDIGTLTGDPDGDLEVPTPLPPSYCITAENPPYYGYRHHCGGTFTASISGSALGYDIDIPIAYDFGPNNPGDTYQNPKVAACCGEYDFDQLASSQPAYWDNCLFDAVQQFCTALPYRLWDLGAKAKANDDPIIANELIKLGNDIATGEGQGECLSALYGTGPEDLNVITGNKWNPVYDLWLSVDFLEILEVALPEDPNEWIECRSIFENDDSVMPDRDPGAKWKSYLASVPGGALQLRGADSLLEPESLPEASASLVLALDDKGLPMVGDLHLDIGAMSLAGVPVERAGFGLLQQATTWPRGDGSFAVEQPALLGAVVLDGDTVTTQLEPNSELVLRPIPNGWRLEAFSLAYVDGEGEVWTLTAGRSTLPADSSATAVA